MEICDDQVPKQELPQYRKIWKNRLKQFATERDHVYDLLGKDQAHSSGVYREQLLKKILRTFLPKKVSVDSGFIYGFEKVPNSSQLDIILWDSSTSGPIFRSDSFVILPPEPVIGVISVKSRLTKSELYHAIQNLFSITPIDLQLRMTRTTPQFEPLFHPIAKWVVSYGGTSNKKRTVQNISDFYIQELKKKPQYQYLICKSLRNMDPFDLSKPEAVILNTIFLNGIHCLESPGSSFVFGFGPCSNRLEKLLRPVPLPNGFHRLPYVYHQENRLTTQIEKLLYEVLNHVNVAIGGTTYTTVAALADINPLTAIKFGDAWELDTSCGSPLIDAENIDCTERGSDIENLLKPGWK